MCTYTGCDVTSPGSTCPALSHHHHHEDDDEEMENGDSEDDDDNDEEVTGCDVILSFLVLKSLLV